MTQLLACYHRQIWGYEHSLPAFLDNEPFESMSFIIYAPYYDFKQMFVECMIKTLPLATYSCHSILSICL